MKNIIKKIALGICITFAVIACGIIIPMSSHESTYNTVAYANEYSDACNAVFEDISNHEHEGDMDIEEERDGCCYYEESDIQAAESAATPYNVTVSDFSQCNTISKSHGAGRENGYQDGFLSIGCCNYKSTNRLYGTTDIPFYINTTTMGQVESEEGKILPSTDNIRRQVEMWNEVVMHDGTGRFVNFYEVDSLDKIDDRPVIEVIWENRAMDDGCYDYSSSKITLRLNRKMTDVDAPMHEFGHALGLADLDENRQDVPHKSVLMGYIRGTTEETLSTAIKYQDIQGAAVINEKHTDHKFTRYIVNGNKYVHLCFYCDIANESSNIISGSKAMIKAADCDHDYRALVSAGLRHWVKCTQCYKVIESPFALKVINKNGVKSFEVTGVVRTHETIVNIPEFFEGLSITSIANGAFANQTEIEKVTIPATVTSIGERVFAGCSNLQIIVDAGNPNYYVKDNILYNKDTTEIIASGKINSKLHIPATVTKISPYAFEGNSNLHVLHLEGRISLGDYAFADCGYLTTVYCYSGVVPGLGRHIFSYNNFILYAPYNEYDKYVSAFSRYTTDVVPLAIRVTRILDGEELDEFDTYFGATVSKLKSPSKFGYEFSGWYDNEELTGTAYENGMIWNSMGKWDENRNLKIYGTLTPLQFYVKFSGEGSEGLEDKPVTYDEKIGELPTLAKTGNNFLGWKDESGTYYNSNVVWKRTSDLTLYSVFEKKYCTIIYDGNGGTPSALSQEVRYGNTIATLATAEMRGRTFLGWNTRADGTGVTVAAPYTCLTDGEMTLYAQYTPIPYTVTYDVDRSKMPGFPYATTVVYGETYQFPAPMLDGYIFNGWVDENGRFMTGANGGAILDYWDIERNCVVTADFTKIEFGVILSVKANNTIVAHWTNGGDEEFSSPDELNSAYLQSPRDLKEGHIFKYFTNDKENGNRILSWGDLNTFGTANGDRVAVIYAKYRKEVFTVAFTGEGVPSGANSSYTGVFGSSIEYVALSTVYGKTFSHWVVANVTANLRFAEAYPIGSEFNFAAMPDLTENSEEDEVTIYLQAVYVPKKCAVTLVSAHGSFRKKIVTVTYGTIPYLPGNYDSDWNFVGWETPDGTMISNDFYWEWEDLTVTAVWQPYYNFIELVCNDPSYYDRVYFTKYDPPYTLPDIEANGYEFQGWYTDENYSERVYQITLATPGRLYARFSRIYTVSIYDGDELLTEIKGTYYQVVTLPTFIKLGYDGYIVSSGLGEIYQFGQDLIIRGNERLDVVWTRRTLIS